MKINVHINNQCFTATLEKNNAVDVFVAMLQEKPVVIQMRDYAGFEKVGSLGKSLPTENRHISTVAGDIVLYNGHQIVMFYGSNSWSYTRLARIDNLNGWKEALGHGRVTAIFTLDDEINK